MSQSPPKESIDKLLLRSSKISLVPSNANFSDYKSGTTSSNSKQSGSQSKSNQSENSIPKSDSKSDEVTPLPTAGSPSLISHSQSPIRFIEFDVLKVFGELPMYSDIETVPIELINRENSLLIYISHSYYKGEESIPDSTSDLYDLCIAGIQHIRSNCAKRVNCYVFIDYCCVDQSNPIEIERPVILCAMQECDLVFTPIIDTKDTIPSINGVRHLEDFNTELWNGTQQTYLSNCWCRLEMLAAVHLPITGNTIGQRSDLFEGELSSLVKDEKRPHYIYSAKEKNKSPFLLPSEYFLPYCNPLDISDSPIIAELMKRLNYVSKTDIVFYDANLHNQEFVRPKCTDEKGFYPAVLFLGLKGSGRTTLIKSILRRNDLKIKGPTAACQAYFCNQLHCYLIDTPGFGLDNDERNFNIKSLIDSKIRSVYRIVAVVVLQMFRSTRVHIKRIPEWIDFTKSLSVSNPYCLVADVSGDPDPAKGGYDGIDYQNMKFSESKSKHDDADIKLMKYDDSDVKSLIATLSVATIGAAEVQDNFKTFSDIGTTSTLSSLSSAFNLGEKILGKGSFGTVLEGTYRGSKVAVKVFISENWEAHRAAVENEVNIHRKLVNVPGVVTFYDALLDSDPRYVVLEMADGSLFSALYSKRPTIDLSFPSKLHYLELIVSILNTISDLGIIHCDIKPSNFLVFSHDKNRVDIKIADFGIARTQSATLEPLKPAKGTLQYMAPEVFSGYYSFASDVYAFGVLINEILSGIKPFPLWKDDSNMMNKVVNHDLRPNIYETNGRPVDELLVNLIESCWQKDPEKRPTFRECSESMTLIIRTAMSRHNSIDRPSISEPVTRLIEYVAENENTRDSLTALFEANKIGTIPDFQEAFDNDPNFLECVTDALAKQNLESYFCDSKVEQLRYKSMDSNCYEDVIGARSVLTSKDDLKSMSKPDSHTFGSTDTNSSMKMKVSPKVTNRKSFQATEAKSYKDSFTLFIDYCKDENAEGFIEHIARMSNVNEVTEKNRSLLMIASQYGHLQIVLHLLANNADINHVDIHNVTALHFAAANGHVHVCASLLRHGARSDAITQSGDTPLHLAVRFNKLEVVNFLCSHSPYTSSITKKEGNTLIHTALINNTDDAIVTKLVHEYPELLRTQNNSHHIPLYYAFEQNVSMEIMWLLLCKLPLNEDEAELMRRSIGTNWTTSRLHYLTSASQVVVATFQIANIHLCGDVGKSTCRKALHHSLKNLNSVRFMFSDSPLEVENETDRTKGMEMEIITTPHHKWIIRDYGGREEYHSIYGRFLNVSNSVYIIIVSVWDFVKNEQISHTSIIERYIYWLKFLESNVKSSIFCISIINFGDLVVAKYVDTVVKSIEKAQKDWSNDHNSIVFVGSPTQVNVHQVKRVRSYLKPLVDMATKSAKIEQPPLLKYDFYVNRELSKFKETHPHQKFLKKSNFKNLIFNPAIEAMLKGGKSNHRITATGHEFVFNSVLKEFSETGEIILVHDGTNDPNILLDINWLTSEILGSLNYCVADCKNSNHLLSAALCNAFTAGAERYFGKNDIAMMLFLENIGALLPLYPDIEVNESQKWLAVCALRPRNPSCECLIQDISKGKAKYNIKLLRRFVLGDEMSTIPIGYLPFLFLKFARLYGSTASVCRLFLDGIEILFPFDDNSQSGFIQLVIVVDDDKKGFCLTITSINDLVNNIRYSNEWWRQFIIIRDIILEEIHIKSNEFMGSEEFIGQFHLQEVYINPIIPNGSKMLQSDIHKLIDQSHSRFTYCSLVYGINGRNQVIDGETGGIIEQDHFSDYVI